MDWGDVVKLATILQKLCVQFDASVLVHPDRLVFRTISESDMDDIAHYLKPLNFRRFSALKFEETVCCQDFERDPDYL